MKRTFVNFLARAVTTYWMAAIAAICLAATLTISLIVDDMVWWRIVIVLLAQLTCVFALLGWFAYVLHSRRTAQERNRKLQREIEQRSKSLEQHSLQSQNLILQGITAAQQQHLDEYQKQAYHLQISLQELRLATLNEGQ
jgi:hypothetical protein